MSLGTLPRSDTSGNPFARAHARTAPGPLLRDPGLAVRRRAAPRASDTDPDRAWATKGAKALSNSLPWVTHRSIRYCWPWIAKLRSGVVTAVSITALQTSQLTSIISCRAKFSSSPVQFSGTQPAEAFVVTAVKPRIGALCTQSSLFGNAHAGLPTLRIKGIALKCKQWRPAGGSSWASVAMVLSAAAISALTFCLSSSTGFWSQRSPQSLCPAVNSMLFALRLAPG
jgi:hypothetical protein